MSRRIERIRRRSICRSEVHHMSREAIVTTNRHSRAAIPVHVPEMERIALPRQRASHTGHAYSPARVTNPNPTNSTPTSNASVSRRPSRNIYPRRTRANHRPTYCPRAFCAARLPSRQTPDTPVTTTPFALPPPPASQPASQPALRFARLALSAATGGLPPPSVSLLALHCAPTPDDRRAGRVDARATVSIGQFPRHHHSRLARRR